MSANVNITQLVKSIKFLINASKESGERTPTLVHGSHGIGKTEIVGQIADELGYNYVPLYLSTQDVSDLLGLPYKDQSFYSGNTEISQNAYFERKNLDSDDMTLAKKTTTRFATPDWLADALADDRPCIFFLDEMNRAPQYVLQTMLPFVLDGRLHTHRIRENDVVIGAMNPETADYNVESITDKALLSRFAHFYFEPEVSEWVQYATKSELHPSIIEVIQQDESVFKNESVAPDCKIQAEPDRRKMYKIGKILNHCDKSKEMLDTLITVCSAMVGTNIASVIVEQFKTEVKLSPDNIFDGSIFKHNISYESDLDKIKLINDSLVSMLVNGEDKLWKVNEGVEMDFNGGDEGKIFAEFTIGKNKIKNLKKWIEKCPNDAQVGLLREFKNQLVTKYETEETPKKGAFIVMSLFAEMEENLISDIIPNKS